MARTFKSQWKFGELFPQEPSRHVYTVEVLTGRIREVLEKEIGRVWVTGEITNLRIQASGHIYFTLKDAAAQLTCVLFRGEPLVNRSLLRDGAKVLVHGEVTVYEPRGQYQLRVSAVELQGVGALQAAFEELKKNLSAEGLFSLERKRPLPRFPARIGLVTSPTGAAIRDVLHVVRRRNPALEIILVACRVQGDGASAEIARGIRLLNKFHGQEVRPAAAAAAPDLFAQEPVKRPLDLILVTRGGGSLEDLWAFNEELVARAIFESELPVVSAVGHEIDFTISDFVADLRAATPSAAAEIITEGVFSTRQFFCEIQPRLGQLATQQIADKRERMDRAVQRITRQHPRRKLESWLQLLDDLHSSMLRCGRQGLVRHRTRWQTLQDRLARVRPGLVLRQRAELLDLVQRRLQELARQRLQHLRHSIEGLEGRLRLLDPQQVLARGYSITMDAETGAVLRDVRKASRGQRLRTRLASGELLSQVESAAPRQSGDPMRPSD
jgi:exodeoxyribonuclease VII large subunit